MKKIILALYIGLLTGMAVASVGQPAVGEGTYGWLLPINIFGMVTLPAVMGYMIGRENKD